MQHHPLSDSIYQLQRLSPYIQMAVVPQLTGWCPAQLATMPSEAWHQLRRQFWRDMPEATSMQVVGSFVQLYARPVLLGAVACMLATGRVSVLDATTTAVRVVSGYPQVLEIAQPAFYCLPDDAAATHPDARVVPDMAALRLMLRAQCVAHFAPLVTWLGHVAGTPAKSLWVQVADVCAGVVVQVLELYGGLTPAQVEHEVVALLGDATSPLHLRRIDIIAIATAVRTPVFYGRVTCCFWYKRAGGGVCTTCPRHGAEVRRQLLTAHVQQMLG